jgi:hypothetical protein
MSANIFDSLSPRERQLAQDRADVLSALLTKWLRRHCVVREVRVQSLSFYTAMVLPRISPTDALISAKLAFWIYGVDDVADERTVPLAELEERAERWYEVAESSSHDQPGETDGLAEMLAEIASELSRFPLFEYLRPHWALEVRRLVQAMIWEYRSGVAYTAGGPDALPTLDEYLEQGWHSIGVPLWALTVWAAADDSSVCADLKAINQATEYAAAVVRLYNDLRTFEKELGEGNVNSVLITFYTLLNEHPDKPVEDLVDRAKQHILQLADSYGQKCVGLVQQIHTDSGKAEEMLSRSVAFYAHFYGRSSRDYRPTSMVDVYGLLGQRRVWAT